MEDDSPPPPCDKSLLSRYRQGDDDAALHLYVRYAERLLLLARRETSPELAVRFDPEDIVQSVFRTFFRRAASGQYEAPEGDELWKLLLVMALNKVRSRAAQHRSNKRDIRKTQGSDAFEYTSSDQSEQEEARLILQLSVDELVEMQPETIAPSFDFVSRDSMFKRSPKGSSGASEQWSGSCNPFATSS